MGNLRFFAISSLFFAFSITVFAQFRIHSNGCISFKTDETPLSPISLNCKGNSQFFLSLQQNTLNGIYCKVSERGNSGSVYAGRYIVDGFVRNTNHIALRAEAKGDTSDVRPNRTYGVMSEASHGTQSFAVLGKISDCTGGAAIYGSTSSLTGSTDNHLYAGYFVGDAKVTGNFTVNGSIQGVLLGGSASIERSNECGYALDRDRTVSDRLSYLTVSSYREKRPDTGNTSYGKELANKDNSLEDEFNEPETTERNIMEEQFYEKNHYALSADQLEEVFPDLVYEKEDGTKAINYVEMIPLLVHTINELRTEVISLKNANGDTSEKTRAAVLEEGETATIDDATSIPAVATLAQNTPNPFSERTTIRFTLPDNVKNAFIYIFDMSGKMQKQIPVTPDMQSVTIEGYELRAGMYIYSLVVGGKEIDTKRMILSK